MSLYLEIELRLVTAAQMALDRNLWKGQWVIDTHTLAPYYVLSTVPRTCRHLYTLISRYAAIQKLAQGYTTEAGRESRQSVSKRQARVTRLSSCTTDQGGET